MSQILDRIREAEAERERVIAERRRLEAEADAALAEREREERRAPAGAVAPVLGSTAPAVSRRASRLWPVLAFAFMAATAFLGYSQIQREARAPARGDAPAVVPVAASRVSTGAVAGSPAVAPPAARGLRLDTDAEAFAARVRERKKR